MSAAAARRCRIRSYRTLLQLEPIALVDPEPVQAGEVDTLLLPGEQVRQIVAVCIEDERHAPPAPRVLHAPTPSACSTKVWSGCWIHSSFGAWQVPRQAPIDM